MYQKRFRQLDTKPGFVGSSPITPVDIPRDGFITRITLDWDVVINNSTASPNAYNAQAIAKSTWTLLTLIGGGQNFITLNDPVTLLAMNRLRHGQVVQDKAVTTASTNTTYRFQQVFHMGRRHADAWDLSAFIPGPAIGSLKLSFTNPANTIAGDGTIQTTSLARIGVHYVQMSGPEMADLLKTGMQPELFEFQQALSNYTTSASGYGSTINLPVGKNLAALTAFLRDNGSSSAYAQDDTRLNQIGLLAGGATNFNLTAEDWIFFRDRSHQASGGDTVSGNTPAVGGVNVGWGRYRFSDLVDGRNPRLPGNGIYGLNLVTAPDGDFKLGFSVGTANGQLNLLYERYSKFI
jgi:hypothetical protein